jgi:hypothetical protein
MLMLRCRKLFAAIDSIETIFKLLHKRMEINAIQSSIHTTIRSRLLAAIKAFLSEHTLFPV